jgi:hypothetical protein
MRVIGYGVCGPGEADRYLRGTLEEFKRLCDETVIVLNNATDKEKKMIDEYGFHTYEDNREWGTQQYAIKQRLVDDHVKYLNPDWCVCLDMDEILDPSLDKEGFKEMEKWADSIYVFIVNMWEEGIRMDWSFWNVRAFRWIEGETEFKRQALHCGLAPQWAYWYGLYSPYYLKHYGLKKREDRQKKIKRYEKYDPKAAMRDRSYYDALNTDNYDEWDEKELKRLVVEDYEKHNKPLKRKNMVKANEEKLYAMTSPSGVIVRVPEGQIKEHQGREFVLISEYKEPEPIMIGKRPSAPVEEKVEEVKEEVKEEGEVNPLECAICGFVAKSKAGLTRHSVKHK